MDEINDSHLAAYYPFVGKVGDDCVYFSIRYLPLVESFLHKKDIKYEIIDVGPVQLPEYNEYQVVKMSIANKLTTKWLRSNDNMIYVVDYVTLLNVYREICAGYHAYNWYPQVCNHTPKSVLIDLNESDINCILNGGTAKADEINNAIAQISGNVFMRLYSLSPKSAYSKPYDLIVKDADEVCRIIRLSERASAELGLYSREGIMLREYWNIDIEDEFRLFVFDSKLIAISQYDCYNYIAKYQEKSTRDNIYNLICNWWNDNKGIFNYSDFIVDIVINDRQINIIEINSYGPGLVSGSALYNWETIKGLTQHVVRPVIRWTTYACRV